VAVEDLEAYERLLIDELLDLPAVVDVRSTFAIRTVKAGGRLPLGR
jgi:Lrp/AsnC family leucine-responsive transcriptional regulator